MTPKQQLELEIRELKDKYEHLIDVDSGPRIREIKDHIKALHDELYHLTSQYRSEISSQASELKKSLDDRVAQLNTIKKPHNPEIPFEQLPELVRLWLRQVATGITGGANWKVIWISKTGCSFVLKEPGTSETDNLGETRYHPTWYKVYVKKLGGFCGAFSTLGGGQGEVVGRINKEKLQKLIECALKWEVKR